METTGKKKDRRGRVSYFKNTTKEAERAASRLERSAVSGGGKKGINEKPK
jgi:hypothetical protein